jgi:hypothetical protein
MEMAGENTNHRQTKDPHHGACTLSYLVGDSSLLSYSVCLLCQTVVFLHVCDLVRPAAQN